MLYGSEGEDVHTSTERLPRRVSCLFFFPMKRWKWNIQLLALTNPHGANNISTSYILPSFRIVSRFGFFRQAPKTNKMTCFTLFQNTHAQRLQQINSEDATTVGKKCTARYANALSQTFLDDEICQWPLSNSWVSEVKDETIIEFVIQIKNTGLDDPGWRSGNNRRYCLWINQQLYIQLVLVSKISNLELQVLQLYSLKDLLNIRNHETCIIERSLYYMIRAHRQW